MTFSPPWEKVWRQADEGVVGPSASSLIRPSSPFSQEGKGPKNRERRR
jgi:hypothetical protein